MHLILVAPGLLESRDAGGARVEAFALAHLLAAAGAPACEAGDVAAPLAARYGIARQDDWPLAPIRLAALAVDPGDAYWLAADPVTLVAGRDDVRLAGAVGDLGRVDADALVAALNAHFAGDGLAFVAPAPDAIFVRVGARARLSTHPLAAAARRPLRALLPEGPDAPAWRRWQSEIQMLLHEHPVNRDRERAGRPPANSLWFSCGGTMPVRREPRPEIRTYAAAGIATALAAYAGSPARPLPVRLDDALVEARGAESTVVALESGLDMAILEQSWAAPAWAALAAGRLESVSILADGAGTAAAWQLRRPGLRQRLAARFRRHDLAALFAIAGAPG
jgi:hypothetical protein